MFPSTEEELLSARSGPDVGLGGQQPTQRHWVLRLRGLPFSAGPEQVVEFFGPEHHLIGGAEVSSPLRSSFRSCGPHAAMLFAPSRPAWQRPAPDRISLTGSHLTLKRHPISGDTHAR